MASYEFRLLCDKNTVHTLLSFQMMISLLRTHIDLSVCIEDHVVNCRVLNLKYFISRTSLYDDYVSKMIHSYNMQ